MEREVAKLLVYLCVPVVAMAAFIVATIHVTCLYHSMTRQEIRTIQLLSLVMVIVCSASLGIQLQKLGWANHLGTAVEPSTESLGTKLVVRRTTSRSVIASSREIIRAKDR